MVHSCALTSSIEASAGIAAARFEEKQVVPGKIRVIARKHSLHGCIFCSLLCCSYFLVT